jgi:nitrogen fixation NifU-like protein
LEDLYQEIILEHSREPKNFRVLHERTHHADGRNPLCGDEISVSMVVGSDSIEAVTFQGQACAISMASGSIMTEAVKGLRVNAALQFANQFISGLNDANADFKFDSGTELAALQGVRRFPSRIKCASLPWAALITALEEKEQRASSEGLEGLILD